MKLSFSAFVLSVLFGGRGLPNTYVHSLSATDNATCGVHPDPHFYAWDGMLYDYQGACDLILINNSNLELQIRTAPRPGYSTTTNVALEVYGLGSLEINETDVVTNTLPPADYSETGTEYEYTPGPGQFIRVTRWTFGLSLQIQANGATFAGSEGMCGSWDDGGINKRDGTPFPTSPMNTTAWAYEWQVDPSESYFSTENTECTPGDACSDNFPEHNPNRPFPCRQFVEHLTLTAAVKNSGLRYVCEKSCNDIDPAFPELINNCVFDKIVTGMNFACNPSYMNPVVIRPDNCPDIPEDPTDPPETDTPPSKWARLVAFFRRFFNRLFIDWWRSN